MDQRIRAQYGCPFSGAKLDCFLIEPEVARGSVVICPGGGYEFCSPREADPVAYAFNRAGYHAFVLWYGCEQAPLDTEPIRELAWAIAGIRRHAASWRLDSKKIAVCGFSAGAHLAGTLGALWQHDEIFLDSGTDERRPDALVLCYPVVTAGQHAHRSSFVRLAGEDIAKQQRFSLETLVTSKMPPTFIWHTVDDSTVSVQNAVLLSEALFASNVPQEVHLFDKGAHGLSLATADTSDIANGRIPDIHVAKWFALADGWLQRTFHN